MADWRNYLTSRFLRWRIGFLWAALTAAAVATSALSFPLLAGLSMGFIAAFRLWDDLADRAYDRVHHPGRVLACTTQLHRFVFALVATLGLLTLAVAALTDNIRAFALVFLAIAFSALYRLDTTRVLPRGWRNALVLVKYPAFVLVLARDPVGMGAVLAASALFIALAINEACDDGVAVLRPATVLLIVAVVVWLFLRGVS